MYFYLMVDKGLLLDGMNQNPIAASKYPGCNSGTRYTAEIKIGNKQLKTNGDWSKNPSINEVHIPIKGK